MQNMITETRVRVANPEKNTSKIKANVSFTLNDVFVVHDIKIVEGSKGLFIAMPGKRIGKDKSFIDIAHPINQDFRIKLQELCMAAYQEVISLDEVDYRKAYSKRYM